MTPEVDVQSERRPATQAPFGGPVEGGMMSDVAMEQQAFGVGDSRDPRGDMPGGPQNATVSIGLVHSATLGGDADMEVMLLAADTALYRAKAEGRNRVVVG